MNQVSYQPQNTLLAYIPRRVTTPAIFTYVMALITCSFLFSSYLLAWQWWFFGIIEVCGFFYFSNYFSKAWINLKSKPFAQKLFWLAFFLRAIWVVISYAIFHSWTGTPFIIGAADEMFYDSSAQYAAGMMRQGDWNIYENIQRYAGDVAFSDMGYPLYLTLVYWIFGDSIMVARIIKAALSAWIVVLMYKLTTRNFGEYTGRMTAIMCMLMPNLMYYCAFQLKEMEMTFLCILFIERADHLLRKGKLTFLPTALLMLIPTFLFMWRTALAVTMVLAFLCALLLSSDRVISMGRRVLLVVIAVVFAGGFMLTNTSIGYDIQEMWRTRGSKQEGNMQWRSERVDAGGFSNRFAKYASATVFAPMIFTLPFPTMTETPGQENQKMIHGGNFVKNIVSFFTIASMFILLFSGEWRQHVLIVAVFVGYLVVLVFSNFAHSERFHLPILPFTMLFAAYGMSKMNEMRWIKKYFPYWCVVMFVAAIAWNWFKLAGRGMI